MYFLSWIISSLRYFKNVGAASIHTVSQYDANGYVGELPQLKYGRRDHACGFYVDSNDNEVSTI